MVILTCSNKQWIAFDDNKSIDIKAKYARVRGLAGLALKDVSQDGQGKCGGPLLEAAYNGLSKQARAPRGAVLHSLEREILETPARPLDTIQVSPYRISRVIDVEGNVHVIRKVGIYLQLCFLQSNFRNNQDFQCSRIQEQNLNVQDRVTTSTPVPAVVSIVVSNSISFPMNLVFSNSTALQV